MSREPAAPRVGSRVDGRVAWTVAEVGVLSRLREARWLERDGDHDRRHDLGDGGRRSWLAAAQWYTDAADLAASEVAGCDEAWLRARLRHFGRIARARAAVCRRRARRKEIT